MIKINVDKSHIMVHLIQIQSEWLAKVEQENNNMLRNVLTVMKSSGVTKHYQDRAFKNHCAL